MRKIFQLISWPSTVKKRGLFRQQNGYLHSTHYISNRIGEACAICLLCRESMSGNFQRVFAREYNESTVTCTESGTQSQTVILTPGGAVCTDLFCAGALLERQGQSGDFMYARLADPTGAFELYIDRSDQFTAEILDSMEIPCFATVIGEARVTGAGPSTKCSIRVRELRMVDRYVRDAWVLRTADLTIRRIERLAAAIREGKGNSLAGAVAGHFRPDPSELRSLALMVREALKGVNAATPAPPGTGDPAAIIREIIRVHGGKTGISIEEVFRQAAKHGLSQNEVKTAVESLLQEDECYQPARGVLKLL
ncbi:MAG: hypothetical protein A4E37_01099 [Methanoregulaceae archaeon PtaB.Bin056]|nr:MAG: hypothetical protein A4E37_01099 [Methanoregulaceae archaeon PtaB.Bin056]